MRGVGVVVCCFKGTRPGASALLPCTLPSHSDPARSPESKGNKEGQEQRSHQPSNQGGKGVRQASSKRKKNQNKQTNKQTKKQTNKQTNTHTLTHDMCAAHSLFSLSRDLAIRLSNGFLIGTRLFILMVQVWSQLSALATQACLWPPSPPQTRTHAFF